MNLNKMTAFQRANFRKESTNQPTQVTYDPNKNLLLKRNILVIKRNIWETPKSTKQQKQDALHQFLAQHEFQNKPAHNLTYLLKQKQIAEQPCDKQLNELESLQSLDNDFDKDHHSTTEQPPNLPQSPLGRLQKPRKQSLDQFMMVGTRLTQSFSSVKQRCISASNVALAKPTVLTTSTIRHDDPLPQTYELLQQNDSKYNLIVSIASPKAIAQRKHISSRAKSATVRTKPVVRTSSSLQKRKKSQVVLNEDIQLITKDNNNCQTEQTITPQQITLNQKSTMSQRPLILKKSANLVRKSHLKRAQQISASHNSNGQFKMEGRDQQCLIQTTNGCQIIGDSIATTALSLTAQGPQPTKVSRPSSAARCRVRGSTVGFQSRKESTNLEETLKDIPLFGLMPSYRIDCLPKNNERAVYRLVVDKQNFKNQKSPVRREYIKSQQTEQMVDLP